MENFDPENYKKKKEKLQPQKYQNSKAPAAPYFKIAKTFLLFFIIIFTYACYPAGNCDLYNTQKNLIYTFLNQI